MHNKPTEINPTPGNPYKPQSRLIGGPGGPTELSREGRPKKNRNRNTRKPKQADLIQADSTSLPPSLSSPYASSAPALATEVSTEAESPKYFDLGLSAPPSTRSRSNSPDFSGILALNPLDDTGAKPESQSPASLSSSAVTEVPARKKDRHKNRKKAKALAKTESQSLSFLPAPKKKAQTTMTASSLSSSSSSFSSSKPPAFPKISTHIKSNEEKTLDAFTNYPGGLKSFLKATESADLHHYRQNYLELHDELIQASQITRPMYYSPSPLYLFETQSKAPYARTTSSSFLSSSSLAQAPSATGVLSAVAAGAHAYLSTSSLSRGSHASSASSLTTETNYQPLVSGHSDVDSPRYSLAYPTRSRSNSEDILAYGGRSRSNSRNFSDDLEM